MPFVTYYGHRHSLDGATLFSKVDPNKLRINVKNKMTLIDAKFDADLINISEVTSRKKSVPGFFGLPCIVKFRALNVILKLENSDFKPGQVEPYSANSPRRWKTLIPNRSRWSSLSAF